MLFYWQAGAPPSSDSPWLILGALVALAAFIRSIWKRAEKRAEWRGRVNTDRDAFKKFMEEVRSDIKKILGYVGPRLSTNESPVVLNELGKEVSAAMGIKAWAKDAAPALLGEIADWREHRNLPTTLRHFTNQFSDPSFLAPSPSADTSAPSTGLTARGRLIQTSVASSAARGGPATKRSGRAA